MERRNEEEERALRSSDILSWSSAIDDDHSKCKWKGQLLDWYETDTSHYIHREATDCLQRASVISEIFRNRRGSPNAAQLHQIRTSTTSVILVMPDGRFHVSTCRLVGALDKFRRFWSPELWNSGRFPLPRMPGEQREKNPSDDHLWIVYQISGSANREPRTYGW